MAFLVQEHFAAARGAVVTLRLPLSDRPSSDSRLAHNQITFIKAWLDAVALRLILVVRGNG